MKKKIILLCVVLFPSLLYFAFELSEANFTKMAYYGPKKAISKGDTLYYSLPETYFYTCGINYQKLNDSLGNSITNKMFMCDSSIISKDEFPIYVMLYLNKNYKNEGYKIGGLLDYTKHKPGKLKDIPIIFISEYQTISDKTSQIYSDTIVEIKGAFDSLGIKLASFYGYTLKQNQNVASFLSKTYFNQKPYYVSDNFMVLVDKERHIRGYYDPQFDSEVKRMIQEFQHLKLRDEHAIMEEKNKIEKNKK